MPRFTQYPIANSLCRKIYGVCGYVCVLNARRFDIFSNLAQNRTVRFEIALICLEFAITFAFMPLHIRLSGHASLAHMALKLDVKIFALRAIRLRVKRKNGAFLLTVNGKKPKRKHIGMKKLTTLSQDYSNSATQLKGRITAQVGADEAKTAAIMEGVIMIAGAAPDIDCRVYDSKEENLELDFGFLCRANLIQIAQLAL